MKGALIGCGFFAENQMKAWQSLPEVEIVAVCDPDPARREHFQTHFGVTQTFAEAQALFEQCRPDFVDIAAPTPAHESLVRLAADHGVAIICQKPFAGSPDRAKALIQYCEHRGVSLSVHENFRWQYAVREVIRRVRDDEIGTPFFGRISYRNGFDVYQNQPYLARAERFIIEDLGIHVLDIARALLGDVSRLSCETNRINPGIQGEDVATMMLRHDGGATSIVDCSYATHLTPDPFPQTLIDIDGTRGSLRLTADERIYIHTRDGCQCHKVTAHGPDWSTPPWTIIQESVVAFQAHWLECHHAGVEADTSGRDNYNTLALVDAAYEAAAHHTVMMPKRWS
ncbi:Gfo/Idh/MocA family protein [Kushneria marisflavi]|uniref:Oxidoreductase n=1 Tax=Kushneria marisflavi TaxID=157779 RepID=A0A240UQB8_9GAMM|nr:Gfo/Idh/MocA family oxidoreductase [Kushneria marisflavi]ART63232.1 oxidoreductase [Kushneria marisflavi]RKD84261.1 putative dehydrogenase [Kushneria marisflavi]